MLVGKSSTSIGQIWRAVQQTNIVSCSINFSQISYERSTLRGKNMSRAGDRSMTVHGQKRMKVQKSIWRPVNAQSHSTEGQENKDADTHIKIGEREHSSATNVKRWIVVNDKRNFSDSNVASISEVQTSRKDVESKSEAIADLRSSTEPIKSFIPVKHVKSEDTVKCVKASEEGVVIEPITMAYLEDMSTTEQQEALSESEASAKCVKENQGSEIELSTTDYENDSVEHKEERSEDTDVKSLKNCLNVVEESVQTSSHSSTIKVDAALLRFVKGKRGKVQQEIEDTTGVKLSFISTEEENTVVVEGPSAESVTTAAAIIQKILDEAVKGPNLQYSHFVSLPLAVNPALVKKLTYFQSSILTFSDCGGKEVTDSESASIAESSEDDSEDFYEGKKVTVNLNVEDASEHVKVEMLEIPVKNEFSKSPKTVSEVESTHVQPTDEISDVKEAVAVKLNVEDGDVRVKLNVEEVPVEDMQAKTQTLYSQAKKNLGIDKSIFIKPKTFHLTVLMLKLWNKERVAAAAEVLQKISPQVKEALEGRPVAVSLKGLELIRGSPAKAHVLYAPVKEVGGGARLQHACRVIIDAFVEAGLVLQKDASSTLKLHATLMNTTHRKGKMFKKYRKNIPFDARHIMELYGSENWGEYVIREAHLSQRFKYNENGYYHCCASIPFPEDDKEIVDSTTEATNQVMAAVTDKEVGDGADETTKETTEVFVQEMAEASAKAIDEESREEIAEKTAQEIAKETTEQTNMKAL